MDTYQIYKNLGWLNALSSKEAKAVFMDCCGSTEWARQMTVSRPYRLVDELFEAAERKWFALTPSDWLEAFAAHPKIGSRKAAPTQQARAAGWSADEQAGMDEAVDNVKADLAEINRLYHDKFGFIFIVCATGRSADEMLAIARARIGNSVETELRIAADEQNKITEIRLKKLLER
ncbi:MAG: 2-oxo-4-hydroxy-4-carboxy-5-ureidoimidazoline decarboxylase [Pyrinomonadaceae bacterium]